MDDLRGELNSLRKEVQILNNKINALSIKLDEIEGVNKLNLTDYSKDTIKSQITPLDNISEKKNSDFTPLESIKNEKFTLLTPENKEQTKNLSRQHLFSESKTLQIHTPKACHRLL